MEPCSSGLVFLPKRTFRRVLAVQKPILVLHFLVHLRNGFRNWYQVVFANEQKNSIVWFAFDSLPNNKDELPKCYGVWYQVLVSVDLW